MSQDILWMDSMWVAAAAVLVAGAAVALSVRSCLQGGRRGRLRELGGALPGPPSLPLLGNALLFLNNHEGILAVLERLRLQYGDWFRFWLGPDLNIIVSDPDDVKTLLSSPKTSQKGPLYKYMREFVGDGILGGSGPMWRMHRKLASPNFGRRALDLYSSVFHEEISLLMERLRAYTHTHTHTHTHATGQYLDVYREIVQCTTFVVCRSLMGLTREETSLLPHLQTVVDNTHFLYETVFVRMTRWWYQVELLYLVTRRYWRARQLKKLVHSMCEAIVLTRMKALEHLVAGSQAGVHVDCCNVLQTRHLELGPIDRMILSGVSREDLINETFTLFTASQEATAKISSALLLMLGCHPRCQEKVAAEIRAVLGKKDTAVEAEELARMPYLDLVFKETMRLFPIGPLLQRTLSDDVAISQGVLPAGASLTTPLHLIMKDPRHWSQPNSFDPDRFLPEVACTRNPNAYMPFSWGPMDCLGREYGTRLVKSLCARVVREFALESQDSYEALELVVAVSVKVRRGYWLALTPRTPSTSEPA